MSWWKTETISDRGSAVLDEFTRSFVINCPSAVRKRFKNGTRENGSKHYRYEYNPVSCRGCSFRERGIDAYLFATILAEIRNPLSKNNCYSKLTSKENVETTREALEKSCALSDCNFEFIVFQKRSDMSDVEAIYYYIRNAFAHGSFEIREDARGKLFFLLESKKNNSVKAQMRLKEGTLRRYAGLASKSAQKIRKPRRGDKKKRKRA